VPELHYTATRSHRLFLIGICPLSNDSTNSDARSWQELNQLGDEDLAAELLAGKHDAFVVLFDRYHKLIFGVAIKIVRDPGEAEEVVQTVFFDAFRGLANFDARRGTLKVWLLQYAYGRALNRQRHLAKHRFYDSLDLENAGAQIASSPSSNACEVSRLAGQLLSELSSRRRTVIELTYFEGLTAGEISERLNLPVGIVRHELYRGLARLRRIIQQGTRAKDAKDDFAGEEVLNPNAQPL